jgi:hypothetical protein
LKLREIGDLANLIAAVGVIISLLFVAYEVNQNTDASLAANRHIVIASLREQLLVRAQSPSLAAAVAAASSGKKLTPVQQAQYAPYIIAVLKSVEEAHFQYKEGGLDKEYLDTRIAGLMGSTFLGNEFGRTIFGNNKTNGRITAEFAQAIDTKFAEMEGE